MIYGISDSPRFDQPHCHQDAVLFKLHFGRVPKTHAHGQTNPAVWSVYGDSDPHIFPLLLKNSVLLSSVLFHEVYEITG